MRRPVLIAAITAGAVIVPSAAYGFWTLSSSNVSGAAGAGALAKPIVSAAMESGSVRISVTGAPTAPVPTSYRVERIAPTAVTSVCTITAVNGLGSCLDTSPVIAQTNVYNVYGKFAQWESIGAAVATASVDVAAPATGIAVSAPASITAGATTQLTITATNALDIPDVTFTGTHTVTITGAANSPNGTAPTYPISATFLAGVATVNVVLTNAVSTTLTVSAAGFSKTTGALSVAPAATSKYALAGPATAQAGVAYTLTSITAQDTYGNFTPLYTGGKTVTWTGPGAAPNGATPTASSSATFTNGVAITAAVTLVKAETAALSASSSGVTTLTPLSVIVGGGLPAAVGFSGLAVPIGTVTCPTTTSCTGLGLGNNGSVSGQIVMTDAYGNPAGNAGAGFTVVFTATQSKGSGAFTVGGTTAASATTTVPGVGSTAVAWSYAHSGIAPWVDVVTVTLVKNGTILSTITATLNRNS